MSGLCVLGHGTGANGEPLHREAEHGMLCLHHRRSLDHLTRDVRDLWYDLTFILEAGTAPKDETPKTRHLKSAEAPAPANLEALALRDPRSSSLILPDVDESTPIPPVLSIVASWLLLVAEERPLTGNLPQSVIAQLRLLERHGDWIAGQPWIDDYVTELGDLRKALRIAVRDVTHRTLGRCRLPAEDAEGVCGGPLIQQNGADSVKCSKCSAQWSTPQELARLSLSLEAK